jgi:hypothetical protein
MDTLTALTILEDAVRLCITENVATEEVLAALDFLGAKAAVKWPFEQFREALAPKEGELDLDREGRPSDIECFVERDQECGAAKNRREALSQHRFNCALVYIQ